MLTVRHGTAQQRGITRFNRQWNQRLVKIPSEKYLQTGIEKLDCGFSHKKTNAQISRVNADFFTP